MGEILKENTKAFFAGYLFQIEITLTKWHEHEWCVEMKDELGGFVWLPAGLRGISYFNSLVASILNHHSSPENKGKG